MIKNMMAKATKTLLIPTLIIAGLSACGYNNGARTKSYDGYRTNNYTGQNYNATGYNNLGTGTANYPGYGVNNYSGAGTSNYNGFGVNNYNGVSPRYDNNLQGYRNYTYGTNNTQQVATKAANTADSVPGVSKATAVVQGNKIAIGIDAASNRTDLRTLEKQVADAVQTQTPGYRVYVTTDSKLNARIQNVYRNLNTNMNTNNTTNTNRFFNTNAVTPGHPVRDLGGDITGIFRDIGRTVTAPFR